MKKKSRTWPPVEVRLWKYVEKTDGCWNWIGRARRHFGYGAIRKGGKGPDAYRVLAAHRVSWEIANGTIPPNMFVLHKCDNPACVRPDHLFLGTIADNNRDMREKGRANDRIRPRGLMHWKATLTDEAIADIVRRRASGEILRTIAADHGISIAHAQRVATGTGRCSQSFAAENT